MAKIAFFDLEPWEEAHLRKRLAKHTLHFIEGTPANAALAGAANDEIIAAFGHYPLDGAALKRFAKLKLVATMSTGFDHIDFRECSRRKIIVCSVPAYGDNTVAEHTFALLLAISRNLLPSIERAKSGRFTPHGLTGFDLKGKTIGIIGTGRIGAWAAHIAHGFGMNVIAFDKRKNPDLEKELAVRYQRSLSALLAKSDIIAIFAPLTPQTHHMIGEKQFRQMKKGVVLLNTSRGGLVDTDALVKAIGNGTVAHAGLDVLEEEAFIREERELLAKHLQKRFDLRTALENHELLNHPAVLVTPHNAFNSKEALQRILDTTAENITAFLAGRPVNLVSLKAPAATKSRRKRLGA
jgi:D-lactate dehydrogenase